jgi:xanthine dehydrogenase/oxidase
MFVVQIFVSKKVNYHGQSIGLIVAESKDIAFEAAKKVKISYEDIQTPIVTLPDAIKSSKDRGEFHECIEGVYQTPSENPESKLSDETKSDPSPGLQTIKGEFQIGGQFHMSMETQTCICIPTEDGMDVYASTQYPDGVQRGISLCLGIPMHE